MKLSAHGTNISQVEILNISQHGIWIWVEGKEYFMDYEHFPWFQHAKLEEIFEVQLLHSTHLYWEKLDVDLDLDSLQHPEKYPLVAE
ncbi:MAG: DUF2442 domain-containing protein [Flavobacteriaceae bacterium]